MEAAEKKACLDLVEQVQTERAGAKLKPSEMPHILLPYQARWHEDQSQVRLGEKSRRIGFSWGALAAEAALEAASKKGMNQLYMGYNLRMAAEFIGDCAFFARAYGMTASAIDVSKETAVIEKEERDVITYKIEFASGHRVEALSSNPHNWRGRQGHARIDEAAFHKNLAELIKGALAFLMWGGRVDIVSTHNGEDNHFNQLIKEIKAGKLPWSRHHITFDDALREGFYERVCLVRGLEWSPQAQSDYRDTTYAYYPAREDAQEELDCIPKRGSGVYFSRLIIEQCQVEDIPIVRYTVPADFVTNADREAVVKKWLADVLKPILDAMPTDKRTVLGQDFGRDGDLSDIWILQDQGGAVWKTSFLLELRRLPFDMQQLILFFIIDNLPLFHHGKFDARGNGQSHAEAALQKYGAARIECVKATPAWYAEHFPRYKAAYEDRSIIVPKSEDIIADHRNVILERGMPTMSEARTKGSDGEYRHGDSAIAGLLAWAAARTEAQPPAGETLSPSDDLYRTGHGRSLGGGLLARPSIKIERRRPWH